jgi:5-methyltetrahydrofolate--homocysteine methyltransferase
LSAAAAGHDPDNLCGDFVRDILELLNRPVVLLDGATGTMLQGMGLPAGAPPEAWILERPDAVRRVAEEYTREGCDVVLTNSFGANRARLEKYGLDGEVLSLNAAAARLAREGAGEDTVVGGSVGPTGLCTGINPPSEEELKGLFLEQCGALADGGADVLVLETFFDLLEFRAALSAAAESGIPFFACMTFQETPRGFFTMMGVTPAQALEAAQDAGALAAGANCTLGSEPMSRLAGELVSLCKIPVAVSPNAGLPELEGDRTVYRQDPADFAGDIVMAVSAGARIVGGCCGTTPWFIREIRAALGDGGE